MLAECHEKMGQGEEAYPLWETAGKIAEAILVKNHPATEKIRSHIAGRF